MNYGLDVFQSVFGHTIYRERIAASVIIIAVLGAAKAMRRGKNKDGPKQWQEPLKQKPPQQ